MFLRKREGCNSCLLGWEVPALFFAGSLAHLHMALWTVFSNESLKLVWILLSVFTLLAHCTSQFSSELHIKNTFFLPLFIKISTTHCLCQKNFEWLVFRRPRSAKDRRRKVWRGNSSTCHRHCYGANSHLPNQQWAVQYVVWISRWC